MRHPLLRWPWPFGRTLDELELQELTAELRSAQLPANATEADYQAVLERLRGRLRGSEQHREASDAR